MSYSLRDLPPCAHVLIDQMRCWRWCDLEELKAAGGTPTARCIKGFQIRPGRAKVSVAAMNAEDHVLGFRGYQLDLDYRCQHCRLAGLDSRCFMCIKSSPPMCMRLRCKSFWYARRA